jgi:F420-non-reducing hydrogenase iron-sulfur subunit
LINRLLDDLQVNPSRLSLEWVSAAEAPRYVTLIRSFTAHLRELGPLGSSEDLDVEHLMVKFKAAKMALEGKRLRMVIARQAKYMKQADRYREIPSDHKLHEDFNKTLAAETASQELLLYVQEKPRSVEELAGLLNLSSDDVIASFNKLEKKKLVESDRLVTE